MGANQSLIKLINEGKWDEIWDEIQKQISPNKGIMDEETITLLGQVLSAMVTSGAATSRQHIKRLLDSFQIPINRSAKETGQTALYLAAGYNHPHIVLLLASRGADVSICDSEGYSPLMIAPLWYKPTIYETSIVQFTMRAHSTIYYGKINYPIIYFENLIFRRKLFFQVLFFIFAPRIFMRVKIK